MCVRVSTHVREPHHQPGVVEVPGKGRHAPVLGVHDGVLYDVYGAGQVGGEDPLGPAGQPVRLGQEAAREEPMVRRHLAENHVLRENMGTERRQGRGGSHFGSIGTGIPIVKLWQTRIQSQ